MAGNRAVVYSGPRTVKVEKLDYPKLVDPRGKKCDHGVIIKLVTTNICGSDLHIYRGRFVAPEGMVLGHENTGEVVETGRDVEFIPLKHDGRVVGAVGSSGGQPDQDHEVAEAGAAAFRPGPKSDG